MKVLIYTREMCPYCKLLKKFLRENKIKFKEIDVDKDRNKLDEMVKKSGQIGVPVVLIGKKVVIGFDKEKLERLLKIGT